MGTRRLKPALLALSVLLGSIVFGWPSATRALSGLSFTPAFIRVDVPAGHNIQDNAIVVKNNSQVSVRLQSSAVDVDVSSSMLTPLTTAKNPATKSVKILNPDLTLEPGQSVNVLVRVDATQLAAGGQFTSVQIKQIANSSKSGLPINQAASIGIFIVKEQGAIRTLKLKTNLPHGLVTSVPTSPLLSFYVDGNVGLVPRAAVTVSEGDDIAANATINDTSATIQPQTSLDFHPVLNYHKTLSPGRHVMSVVYRFDGQAEPFVIESTFWYVPVWYLFIIVLGLAGLAFLWWHHRQQPIRHDEVAPEPPSETIEAIALQEEVVPESPSEEIAEEAIVEPVVVVKPLKKKPAAKKKAAPKRKKTTKKSTTKKSK